MPKTNSWLVAYSIAQLGKPYKMNAGGEYQVSQRYSFTEGMNAGPNPYYNQSVKMHDCSGLPYGALRCTSFSGPPVEDAGITHYTQTQFDNDCDQKGALSPEMYGSLHPGVLVFNGDLTNIYHTGVYVGPISYKGTTYQYGVVEACGSNWGIIISDLSHWRWWGQLRICRVNTSPVGLSTVEVPLGPYGDLNETPSNYNQQRQQQLVDSSADNVNYVQTGVDEWGNPIGYSYTTGASFTPYIAKLPPTEIKVDYSALIGSRVSGMMFCAGWLYDSYYPNHVPRHEYVNPHLQQQVVECQGADLPFALYAIVRAKSRIEADRECRALYYVISKYPPKLGLWLSLDMHNQKALNEEILDCYYSYIVQWGLINRCGLYVDKSALNQITWDKYQNKFYLWLIDHVEQSTLNTINDRVLTSDFFEVE